MRFIKVSSQAWVYRAGDCIVRGYDPPRQATVLQDADVDKPDPLLKPPRVFELVWCDEAAGRERGLAIWRPVPQPGCAPNEHHLILFGVKAATPNNDYLLFMSRHEGNCVALADSPNPLGAATGLYFGLF